MKGYKNIALNNEKEKRNKEKRNKEKTVGKEEE